jgi:hydroxymethylpyrimidine kinase/phosphomethylpyrimidine kinase
MRPYVITIAGHDPSGGAGLNADTKTFENLNVYGLSVCSAITYQDEDTFEGVDWVSSDNIIKQLDALLKKYHVGFIKVGLIESFNSLKIVLAYLKAKYPAVKVVWDPILRATSGFTIHSIFEGLDVLLDSIYILTPNRNEILQLTGLTDSMDAARTLSAHTYLLLKGGHAKSHATDIMFYKQDRLFDVGGDRLKATDKHGTGCVLSASIVSYLALGNTIEGACVKAKKYVEDFLQSNDSRLGYHS